jgi:diguanylate cyclase (GGDEF)-like protein
MIPPSPAPVPRLVEYVAQLQREGESARQILDRLNIEIAEARHLLKAGPAEELRAANEQLVRRAIEAAEAAEECERSLASVEARAQRDGLTQLPNRELLLDRLSHAIAHARRHELKVAVLFVDLDNFKQINDRFGHAVGDDALKTVAARLLAAVRDEDTVSRRGGDEFVVLLADVASKDDALAIGAKLVAAMRLPFEVRQLSVALSCSVGIAMYPHDGEDAGKLIERADEAMYRAKRNGSRVDAGTAGVGARRADGPDFSPIALRAIRETPPPIDADVLREANEQLLLSALSSQDLQIAAEASHRRLRDHLAVVAHELRGPLSPLRIAATLLTRTPPKDFPRLQAMIEREVVHMSRLISDLLDVSRVLTGKLRFEQQLLCLRRVLEESIEASLAQIEERQQRLEVLLDPEPMWLSGDATRLAQAFRNLLDNASKYTPTAGQIRIELSRHGDLAHIAVSDDGIGISAAALPIVFEPFTQEAHAIGFSHRGLGIGLAVVREVVEAHGGRVAVSSAGIQAGSRFVVELPVRPVGAGEA